jgi:hypothetical protein
MRGPERVLQLVCCCCLVACGQRDRDGSLWSGGMDAGSEGDGSDGAASEGAGATSGSDDGDASTSLGTSAGADGAESTGVRPLFDVGDEGGVDVCDEGCVDAIDGRPAGTWLLHFVSAGGLMSPVIELAQVDVASGETTVLCELAGPPLDFAGFGFKN